MFGYDSAGRKACGINGFSQCVLRSSVQCLCVVKQCDRSNRRSQEESAVVFSEGVVADSSKLILDSKLHILPKLDKLYNILRWVGCSAHGGSNKCMQTSV